MTEQLLSAARALAHSAQADGVVERSTAIWCAREAERAAATITQLRELVREAMPYLAKYTLDTAEPNPNEAGGVMALRAPVDWLSRACALAPPKKP